jgi:excinuclease ABC subunit C
MDVIGLSREGEQSAFKLFFIRHGIMTGYRQFVLDHTSGETDQGLMRGFIEQFYAKEIIPPRSIICSALPEDQAILLSWLSEKRGARVSAFLPERGIKKELVTMAVENAAMLLKTGHGQERDALKKEIAELLGLLYPPADIGAFDVSNISGSEPVAAFVYWKDSGFRKERYRHIRMDAVKGPDDYAMMRGMVMRTFEKQANGPGGGGQEGDEGMTDENRNAAVPDLIIIDGGRGQLDAAMQALGEMGIRTNVISIAKDPDRAFIPGRVAPVGLEDGRRGQLLLKRIRDEVHRFAISYHKKLRARRMLESPLEKIPGIGRKRRLELLRHFGSIEGIRGATAEEIAGLKGFNRTVAGRLLEGLSGDGPQADSNLSK